MQNIVDRVREGQAGGQLEKGSSKKETVFLGIIPEIRGRGGGGMKLLSVKQMLKRCISNPQNIWLAQNSIYPHTNYDIKLCWTLSPAAAHVPDLI